jgi:nucleotide sugar dehydrogenase
MSHSHESKFDEKNVTVIGIGRLGLCFALVLARKGYKVVGIDINPSYVGKINDKSLQSNEPFVEQFLKETSNLRASTSIDEGIAHSDVIFILVDTPSSGNENHYDHSKLGNVLVALNQRRVQNKHIVVGCTVIPGYIAKVGRFLIKDCIGSTLSYNPEFIAQGNIINGQLYPDMVLVGRARPRPASASRPSTARYARTSPTSPACRPSPPRSASSASTASAR